MKNLYIVRSPLQLINAMEAKSHFKRQNNILCIVHNKSKINSLQMRQLLSFTDWDETVEVNQNNQKNSLFNNIKFIKKLRTEKYDYLFTGHLGNINIALISSLDTKKIFLIDDGTATIALHNTLLNPNIKQKKSLNSFIREYRYKLFGLQCSLKNRTVNYFTFFDITPYKNEKVIQNRFQFLKNSFFDKLEKSKNRVYLLGQNFVEIGAMEEDIYIRYIKNIINHYKDKTIIYYPHRSEEITEKYDVVKSDNFIIGQSTQPIEIEFITKSIYPTYIVSFISTALFSLHKIFPDANIDSFVIDKKDLLSHHEIIETLYKNQNASINQIHID